jgi:hypothetical protein
MPSHDKTQRATFRDALRLISHKHDYIYSLQSTVTCFSASSRVVKALLPITTMVLSVGRDSTTLHFLSGPRTTKYSLAANDGVAMPTIRARGRTYFIGRLLVVPARIGNGPSVPWFLFLTTLKTPHCTAHTVPVS